MEVNLQWQGGLAFATTTASGHEVKMDAVVSAGGKNTGPSPMELLLLSLAGCTGIDIVLILKKMRQEIKSFQMEVNGEREENDPKRFKEIHVHYTLEGDIPEEKVVRAIQLSKDKYCSVAHSLNANITASFSINGVKNNLIL